METKYDQVSKILEILFKERGSQQVESVEISWKVYEQQKLQPSINQYGPDSFSSHWEVLPDIKIKYKLS